MAFDQPAEIIGVKPVGILVGGNGFENHPTVDVFRKGKLNENAVDFLIGVFLLDQCQEFGLSRAGRQFMVVDVDPGQFAGLLLVLHIDVRRRIVADQDRRQPRFHSRLGQHRRRFHGQSVSYLLRQCFPVNQSSCHNFLPVFSQWPQNRGHLSRAILRKST